MKKLIVILALVAVACAPAMAAVTVNCAQVGTTKDVDVSYRTDGNGVRAFALDLSVNGGAKITALSCASAAYYVYPGSITINNGSVTSYGDCVCDATKFPGVTQPGRNNSSLTVEMGSLYTGTTNKPASSGVLVRLTVDVVPTTVTIGQNTARGGVVMERPEETPTVTLSTCAVSGGSSQPECFPSGYTSYNDWKTMGKPDCWCGTNTAGMTTVPPVQWKYQCVGDADNKTQTIGQSYRVYTNDFNILLSNWQKKITSSGLNACADFDHKSQTIGQSYRVYTNDFNILLSNWQKKDSGLTGNCPRGI